MLLSSVLFHMWGKNILFFITFCPSLFADPNCGNNYVDESHPRRFMSLKQQLCNPNKCVYSCVGIFNTDSHVVQLCYFNATKFIFVQ